MSLYDGFANGQHVSLQIPYRARQALAVPKCFAKSNMLKAVSRPKQVTVFRNKTDTCITVAVHTTRNGMNITKALPGYINR
jgi:hypothetical protein